MSVSDAEKIGDGPPTTTVMAPQADDRAYSSFTTWDKRIIIIAVTMTALFSPISAQIYLPALTQISDDLNITSTQINLTITSYMIFQGIVPMVVGSLADSGGRRPSYVVCLIVYLVANVGLALAPNYEAILVLRCLQSSGSSSTVALCTAVVADLVTSAERGQYVGITIIPGVLAPAIGPVIGGLLAQALGWRSIFWFLAIAGGVGLCLIIIFLPETCRLIVGDGSLNSPWPYRTIWQKLRSSQRRAGGATDLEGNASQMNNAEHRFKFKTPNLLGSLVILFQKESGLILFSNSMVFAGLYCVVTAMPTELKKTYGYDETQVGLMYLPLAFGSAISAFAVGPLINKNYKRHCNLQGIPFDRTRQQDLSKFPIEKARLEVGLPLLAVACAGLIGWGWTLQAQVHPAAPATMSAIFGAGMIGLNNSTNILLVDIHPGKAGTATAAGNVSRCLVGAGASAAIVPMIDAVGVGWAFTIVGAFSSLCLPASYLVMAKGVGWREQQRQKEEQKKLKKLRKEQVANVQSGNHSSEQENVEASNDEGKRHKRQKTCQ